MKRISKQILLITLILSFLGFWAPASYAADNLRWNKNVDEMTVNLTSICFGNGIFVAVGEDGIIKTSPDGYQWTYRNSETNKSLWGVSWCNNQFIAVGSSGLIITSADGITWTNRTSGTKYSLTDAIWDGKQYIVVGGWGAILTSSDGANWKELLPVTDEGYSSIAFNNGVYIIAADKSIVRSVDGINWTIQEFPEMYGINNVLSNGNIFAVTGWRNILRDIEDEEEYLCILTSKDGIQWSLEDFPYSGSLEGIACNGASFLIVGSCSIATSKDGTSWSFEQKNGFYFSDVVYADEKYVGVGVAGEIDVSKDGKTWYYTGPPNDIDLDDLIWTNNAFIGVGGNGNNEVMFSTDGKNWSGKDCDSLNLKGIEWDGSKYVALGVGGYVLSSTDGINWNSTIISGNPYLLDIEWNGSIFVATGDKGEIFTSSDGETWTRRVTRTDNSLNGVAWNEKQFVAVGGTSYKRIILTSPDGINWTAVSTSDEFYTDLRGITWANNQFIAYGSSGYMTVSKDGTNWTPVKSKSSVGINDLVWTGSKYYYIGDFGLMGSSVDGVTWQLENSGTTITLKTISWNGEKLLAAGYNSAILTSVPADIIKVKVDDKPVIFDVAPITKDGRTLVPLRAIFEALGVDLNWNGPTQTVYATKDSFNMILKVGSKTASINGNNTSLEVPAINYNGRVLVPTRFIAESFGANISWDQETRTVIIKTKEAI